MELPYAEEINYWKTGRSSPDTWIERTIKQIEKFGGKVLTEAFGSEPTTGRSAFMIGFEINSDKFKVVWPVLPTKAGGNERAARIQAATMLYHDVKARCISATVLGSRKAFFSYLLLADGKTASETALSELSKGIPKLLEARHRADD